MSKIIWIVVILALSLFGCGHTGELFPVTRVVDGDTLVVRVDGKDLKVRVLGLDTPETVHPSKPVQCFGREASAHAKSLLTGQKVRLELDPTQGTTDKYGRAIRHVFLADGRNYALEMIRDGYGHEYTYGKPHEYRDAYRVAQNDARENNRGLWSLTTCAGDTKQPATDQGNPAPENKHHGKRNRSKH